MRQHEEGKGHEGAGWACTSMMHAKMGIVRLGGRDIEHDVRTGFGSAQQTQLGALGGLMDARAGGG